MKKLTLIIAVIMLVTMLPISISADEGNEYSYFTDFEGYNGTGGAAPDSNWGSGYQISPNVLKQKFGAYSDGANRTMKLELHSEPILWLGQLMNKGMIHTSGYVKVCGANSQISLMSYDGRNSDSATIDTYLNKYSKYIRINYDGTAQYYPDPIDWVVSEPVKVADEGEWIKLDVIMTELSDDKVFADYYANGIKLNPEGVDVTGSLGLRGIFYRFENQPNLTAASNAYGLVDNVLFERFFGSKSLEATISNKIVAAENGSINVTLSDNVDEASLTKENIVIKNVTTGRMIEDFEITDASASGFTVKFNETLERGQRFSLMLSSEIKGKLFNTSMKDAVKFMSENRLVDLGGNAADMNFDSYSPTAGELPEGFVNLEGADFVSSQAVGRSGEAGDNSWSFLNAATARTNTRFMYEFSDMLPFGTECEISFDVYSSNIYWYFYLAENGDFDAENDGYDENLVISSERNGVVRYASSRSDRSSGVFNNSLATNQGDWTKVLLKVVTGDDGTKYKITLDNGAEYEVSPTRTFENGIAGFGFGYIATANSSELRIDNVKIGYSALVECPEVWDISLFDIYGENVEGKNITSMISGAWIEFSAFVDETSAAEHILLLNDGTECDFDYRLENLETKSRMVLSFPELLKGGSNYTLMVLSGVEAGLSEVVTSAMPMEISFSTIHDDAVRIYESCISDDSSKYELSFAKNIDKDICCYAIVGVYEEVVRKIDGVDTVVKKLKNVNYLPVILGKSEMGIYKFEMPLSEEAAEIKLITWPELKELKTDSKGNIIFQ